MRTHLVSQMFCADCGHLLEIDHYRNDKHPTPNDHGTPVEITGAAMVLIKPIMVKPCKYCAEPLTRMQRILTEFANIMNQAQEDTDD